MKTIRKIVGRVSGVAWCVVVLSAWNASAQALHVDSVFVDSVWNSDSSWYDENGVLQQRYSRDCRVGFLPQDTGSVTQCTVSISLDSGKTWDPDPNPLRILVGCAGSFVHKNQEGCLVVRVLGQDRPNVVFRIATTMCPVPEINSLIITNQISGWVVDSSRGDSTATAMPFVDSTVYRFFDGGCVDYCGPCNGSDDLKDGILTYLKNPQSDSELTAIVIDYGTDSGAKAEFNLWITLDSWATRDTISPFSDTTALGFDAGGGGLSVHAHFRNYYIELDFSNYASPGAAVPDARAFLNYYYSKISR